MIKLTVVMLINLAAIALAQQSPPTKQAITPAPKPLAQKPPSQADPEATAPTTESKEDVQWSEVHSIIDEIKFQNPPRQFLIRARTGLVQMSTNAPDAVKLGQASNLVGVGIEGVAQVWENIGMEARFLYAQNVTTAPGSPNGAGASIWWADVGPRYTLFLDSTNLNDTIVLKALYHQNDANFKLAAIDNAIFMNHYMGISGSVERNIPITRKLGVSASLDLLQILDASSPSTLTFQKTGYGFEVKGEIYYQVEVFSQLTRLGFSYWQQGNSNELGDTAKATVGKNVYFQLSRAFFVSLSALF